MNIPSKILPKTLKKEIILSNISKIEFIHRKKPLYFSDSLQFVKTYIPAIRYHNSKFKFQRKIVPKKNPIFILYNQENKVLAEINTRKLTTEIIYEKIMEIDKKPPEQVPENKEKQI